ncbi:hypothetical protein BJY01DRAFT_230099 [Aspergillus pseudoustus]|uniref:Uncharacterized protein n=1 Tax=Aspergillus pseudoustus TaxID=1810923 RepID=A0ABR4ID67_9EURO
MRLMLFLSKEKMENPPDSDGFLYLRLGYPVEPQTHSPTQRVSPHIRFSPIRFPQE